MLRNGLIDDRRDRKSYGIFVGICEDTDKVLQEEGERERSLNSAQSQIKEQRQEDRGVKEGDPCHEETEHLAREDDKHSFSHRQP